MSLTTGQAALTFVCPTCKRASGSRCVTASGAATSPHIQRWRLGEGWVSRQDEVDRLEAHIEELATDVEHYSTQAVDLFDQLAAAKQALVLSDNTARDLAEQLKTARAGAALVPGLQARVAELMARVAELETPPVVQPKILLGAGGGNLDRTKTGIDVDRWYGGSGDVDKAVAKAKANHAAGILTWASFKLPFSWADMAAGKGDTWATALFAKLDALGFDVWIAFHHEPEGDGDTALWRKMQDRLSRLVPGGTTGRIKFWLITTGWHQEFGTTAANKWEALYPVGAPIYGIAYDAPYLNYGKPTDPTKPFDNGWTEGKVYVDKLAARAKTYGVKAAIGEFGYSDEAFTKDAAWLDHTLAAGRDAGLLAMCYFDTPLNSAKSWYLGATDGAKRKYFYAATKAAKG